MKASMRLNDGQIGPLTTERLISRLKGLHCFVCHLSDPVFVLHEMPTCINLYQDLSQIGLPIPEVSVAIEREKHLIYLHCIIGKLVSPVLIRPLSYLQVIRASIKALMKLT